MSAGRSTQYAAYRGQVAFFLVIVDMRDIFVGFFQGVSLFTPFLEHVEQCFFFIYLSWFFRDNFHHHNCWKLSLQSPSSLDGYGRLLACIIANGIIHIVVLAHKSGRVVVLLINQSFLAALWLI